MAQLLENFIDITYEIRSSFASTLPANITNLELIEETLKREYLLEILANKTNLTAKYINDTVGSVYASVEHIQAFYDIFSSTNDDGDIDLSTNKSYCGGRLDSGNLLMTSFIPALVIIFILSFVNTRIWKRKCCWGRPGLAIPVNLLDSYEDRYTYGYAFGATASRIIQVIIDNDFTLVFGEDVNKEIQEDSSSSTKAILKIMAAIFVGVSYYPFFACISTHQRLLGAVLGTIYSAVWFLTYLFQLIDCSGSTEDTSVTEDILLQATSILFHGLLLLSFMRVLIRSLISKRRGIVVSRSEWRENYKYLYVKKLLKPVPTSNETLVEVTGFKQKIFTNLYHWKPDFKYSTRIICIYITGCACLYLAVVFYVFTGRQVKILLHDLMDYFEESDMKSRSPSGFNWDRIRNGVNIIVICWMIAIGFAAIKDLIMVANMLSWYRGHVLRLQKGDKSFLPYNVENQNHVNIMVSSFKFAGYQAGYIIWSFIITHIVLFLIATVIALGFIWPLTWGGFQNSFVPEVLQAFGPTIMITLLTLVIQKLLAKFVFLRDHGAMLALNNRRLYHIASYFFFFMNIFVGIFSCLIRIFYAILFGALFLPRLQKSTLPRDWELFDPGYKTYIGYLFLEHTHANPVLLTFNCLLWECVKCANTDSETELNDITIESAHEVNPPRAKIRWFLALTLINNPQLQQLRRREVQLQEEQKGRCVQIKEFKTKVVQKIEAIRNHIHESKL